MKYREGDEPFTIKLPPGTDTSKFFKFNPGKCADCEYRGIGFCTNGGTGESAYYCSVHRHDIQMRVLGYDNGR